MTESSRTPDAQRPSDQLVDTAEAQEAHSATPDTSVPLLTPADIFGTTTNPCPTWCERPAGHGYESTTFFETADGAVEDGPGNFRTHEVCFDAGGIETPYLSIGEELLDDGSVRFIELQVNIPEYRSGLTSTQARALAEALRAAADKYDEVAR